MKICALVFLMSVPCIGMHPYNQDHEDDSTIVEREKQDPIETNPTLAILRNDLFARLGDNALIFKHSYPEDRKAKILERFECNYLAAAVLLLRYYGCSSLQASRLAYWNTVNSPIILHNIVHGTINYDIDDYEGADCRARMQFELEHIKQQINQFYAHE